MPQETDASTLISVLSAIWLYWVVASWIEYFQRLVRGEDASPHLQTNAYETAKSAPSAGAAVPSGPDTLAKASLQRDAEAAIDELLVTALPLYETIVTAFDAGDRATLHDLVAPDVYRTFSDAMATRTAEESGVETVFSRLEPPEIVAVVLDGLQLQVSVRFAGEAFRLSRDAAGQARGTSPRPRRNVDEWTFARGLGPRDSAWSLIATGVGR